METPYSFESLSETYAEILPNGDTLMWSLFGLIFLYALIHGIVFWYHWHKYNIAPGPFQKKTYLVYYSGSGFFLIVLFFSTLAIVL